MDEAADRDHHANWEASLSRVRGSAGTRELLLLAAALCRRIWERFPYDDCREAVQAIERLAHHPDVESDDPSILTEADAALEQLQRGYDRVAMADTHSRGAYLAATACCSMWYDPKGMIEQVAEAAAIAAVGDDQGPAWYAERQAQIELFEAFTHQQPPHATDA